MKILISIILSAFVAFSLLRDQDSFVSEDIQPVFENYYKNSHKIDCISVYDYIEKYSELYNIPKHIAYNIAYLETRYMGPLHFNYDGKKTSSAGALGPMQIMPSTANSVNGYKINRTDLIENIEINVETSMKLLQILYKKYGNWQLVCGAYNTGMPIMNSYSEYCVSNRDYKNKWVSGKL